jgi:phenylacetaldehyde dehydrogenase
MNEMTKIAAQPAYSEAAQKALAREPALFIDGEWVRSSHDRAIPVFDPSTGRQISSFVDASDNDVDRALLAARTAFDDGRWSGLSPYSASG